ncbi:MAG: hypothetical protein JW731_14360 [Bacteroidales bacterium]|nr:hypothetical protein [Bacteroidales bacterium]
MDRKEYEKKLIEKKGKEYLDKNKELLNDEWDYIESLGEPSDIKKAGDNDLIISTAN